ncbi:ATP-grasp domain-containing protein [Actinomadura atramentaria]|uniref:ATP-grasp domain-containing protein n=1 Tax=Actinomadura atramentaria TaxID=1990 RepID=UPI00037FD19A|nr:hypothetical protein [Actinomadura atramentaria]
MILLWGHPADRPFARMVRTLRERGAPLAVLDQRRHVAVVGTRVRTGDGVRLDLADVTAAYLRPYDAARMAAVTRSAARTALTRRAARAESALTAWADHAPARVVNRPSASASNGAKAYQGRLIEAAGLAVPPSLVTGDADALAAFTARHGTVVVKPGSGVRARVALVDPGDRDRLARLAACPTYFQRYVPGDDVRVHVVGDRVFAVRVESEAVDYRTPGADPRQRRVDLPADLAARCVALTRGLGLHVAGIDLRVTPDGEWFCFEANPAPAFTYYADADDVAAAVADLLTR